jgi:hypothetical protein
LLIWPLAARALLHLADDDLGQAATAVAQARASGGQDNTITYRMMLQAESELELAEGNYQAVIARAERVSARMRAEGGRLPLCEALAYLGRALLGAGSLEAAEAALREAQAIAVAAGLRPLVWRVTVARVELEIKRGNPVVAEALRGEMRALLDDLAQRTGSPAHRAGFLATRAVRAALAL